jgi:hypothetical protein
MKNRDLVRLLHDPYTPPDLRVGDRTMCLIERPKSLSLRELTPTFPGRDVEPRVLEAGRDCLSPRSWFNRFADGKLWVWA